MKDYPKMDPETKITAPSVNPPTSLDARPKASPNDREIWDKAIEAGKHEPRDVLRYDKKAVRDELRDSRNKRGVRVKSILP